MRKRYAFLGPARAVTGRAAWGRWRRSARACCVATGDGGCEAYTAIAWGVGLSLERSDIAGAEGFHSLEGNMCGTAMRGAVALPGSKATSRAKGSYRNRGDLGSGRRCCMLREYGGPHREGEEPKPMMHGHEKVGPRHSSNEAGEQSEGTCCGGICRGKRSGVGGAKGGGQGECAPAKHALDLAPGSRVTGAGAHTATMCRHTPEAGAVCGKAARTDLGRGACDETHVPTATAPGRGRGKDELLSALSQTPCCGGGQFFLAPVQHVGYPIPSTM